MTAVSAACDARANSTSSVSWGDMGGGESNVAKVLASRMYSSGGGGAAHVRVCRERGVAAHGCSYTGCGSGRCPRECRRIHHRSCIVPNAARTWAVFTEGGCHEFCALCREHLYSPLSPS
ncbi:hypothetical protein OF83DRAFT_772566 [Amylostereum chailletii]|nr:hypothetical protein OF83DRAFT_772566 [Amylostereum chailletii]